MIRRFSNYRTLQFSDIIIAAVILIVRRESLWRTLNMIDLQAIWSVLTAIVLCLFVLVVVVRCCNMWERIVMTLPIQLIALDWQQIQ